MFRENERIFLPGSSGEPTALVPRVFSVAGAQITTSFVPGVNKIPTAALAPGVRATGFFMQAGLADAQRAGTFRHLPLSYAAIVKWLDAEPSFDTVIIQVTPPNDAGICSLGPAAEFTPIVLRRAHRVVAVINPNMPFMPNAPVWRRADIDAVIEAETPLAVYDSGRADAVSDRIAAHVAALIDDGAVLQLGLGKVPAAICAQLVDRRRLKLHTGMVSDGIIALDAGGALAADWPHKTTVLLGSERLYNWARDRSDIHVAACDEIHAPRILSSIEGLVAINSALEVDLFGQCNLERAAGNAVSGAGGAPDFAHAASLSKNGFSIVALPATFGSAKGSRIKPVLGSDNLVTLPRTDIDIVVTEEGIADLRGRSVHERAERLINIAAAPFRAELTDAWREIRRRL